MKVAREQFQTLSEPMYYILLALTEPCCGVDIMQKVQEISHDRVSVGPGTLYALLAKFESSKMICEIDINGRKRTYHLTHKGRETLEEEHDRLARMVEEGQPMMRQKRSPEGNK